MSVYSDIGRVQKTNEDRNKMKHSNVQKERMMRLSLSLRKRMQIICIKVLGEDHYNTVTLPEAMKSTALILFLKNEQSMRTDLVRTTLNILNTTGVIK